MSSIENIKALIFLTENFRNRHNVRAPIKSWTDSVTESSFFELSNKNKLSFLSIEIYKALLAPIQSVLTSHSVSQCLFKVFQSYLIQIQIQFNQNSDQI